MKFYFAPLEGITGYLYRNTHRQMFGGIDCYFSPFISPTSGHNFKSREKRDILPENNVGTPLVPQILTNHADAFLYTAECLMAYGYQEVNLNLGCPSGTVVSKGRGSGFLSRPEELEVFLDEIFSKTPVPVSIKTRIGKESADEFAGLMQIYNRFPIRELTIHPRVQKDYYKNRPDWDVFEEALAISKNPICYNGDINTREDYERFCRRFPTVDRIMIGRGLIADPALVREIRTGQKMTWEECMAFSDSLCEKNREIMDDRAVLFKMKEIWSYMSKSHAEADRVWKKIKKTKKFSDYENVMRCLR